MRARKLQRKCSCGGACNSCRGSTVPQIVHRVLGESGRPLDRDTRARMEPRFGRNFSSVRVHDGSPAAESAAAVDALAYTVGDHVVFGRGGSRDELLAHELTHVVQQSGAPSGGPVRIGDANDPLERDADAHAAHAAAPRMLQRACPPTPTGLGTVISMPPCELPTARGSGESFKFCQDSAELLAGEETRLAAMAPRLAPAGTVRVHGYASTEGPSGQEEEYNLGLSCHRANHVANKLVAAGVAANKVKTYKHGATSDFGADLAANRRVMVAFEVAPEPPKPKNCGPDITKWFVSTMNAAKFDPRVQKVERGLAVAASLGAQEGLSSVNAVEEELRDRANDAAAKSKASQPPPKNVQDQLSAAGKHPNPKRPWFNPYPNPTGNILGMGVALYRALSTWRDLVNHGAPFDFKAHKLSQSNLNANGCDDHCANASVTIAGKCFRNDVPGNLFYAYIGGWVGLSENSLQLGSIVAQLNSPTNPSWDPPDDTQMISIGYNLPKFLLNEMTLPAHLASVPAREPCTPCTKEYWPK